MNSFLCIPPVTRSPISFNALHNIDFQETASGQDNNIIDHHGHVHVLSEEDVKLQEMRRKILEEHKGHEFMHIAMFCIFIITIIIIQIAIYEWKRRHVKSYKILTLFALWIVPLIMAARNQFWRFIATWVIYTIITGVVVRKAIEKPISGTAPRLAYKWFYLIYKTSYALGIIGYIIALCAFLGVNTLFDATINVWMDTSFYFFFYGLYYGVMGQDMAEMCTDKMAAHIGYYTEQGMPTRFLENDVCAVCGNKFIVGVNQEGIIENTYKLSCQHVFHEFCIRGWCIVGKKQICPYCKEKVDLKRMFPNPWEKPHVLYGQLLDWLRYMITWQPIIFLVCRGVIYVLGLD